MSAGTEPDFPQKGRALQEAVRLCDPLWRMRVERRVTLLLFNGLLFMVVLLYALSYGIMPHSSPPAALEPPPAFLEASPEFTEMYE
jgi:hypothetical protein